MQEEQLHWLRQWYSNSPDYVIALTLSWEIIWQNRDCPMLPKDTDCCQSLGLKKDMPPVRGTYALCYAGELYSFQLDLPDTDSAQMILIRISEKPYSHLEWSNSAWRNEADNRSAVLRSQVFGISNAASTLYNMIEEISDEFPQLQDKSMVQIDIIKGNCCQMLRSAVSIINSM